jgi:hypothetical protein
MIVPSFKFAQGDLQKCITLPQKMGREGNNGIKFVLISAFDQGN